MWTMSYSEPCRQRWRATASPKRSGGMSVRRSLRYTRPAGVSSWHTHSGEVRPLRLVPVTHGHVGDVVPARGDVQREIAHPALGAADGLREEMVVDEAYPGARAGDRVAVPPSSSQ